MDNPVRPHGGVLRDLRVDEERAELLKAESGAFASITLTGRQVCDLELLINGAFSPLQGFMNRAEYDSVCRDMRLPDGALWPIPITLDVPAATAEKLAPGVRVALRDGEGFMLAVMTVDDVWERDRMREAELVYGTTSTAHPGVDHLLGQAHPFCVGGAVEGIQLPSHHDFETLRDTPEELRKLFEKLGWRRVVAFHTSKPMHRVHRDVTLQAAKEVGANILLHPVVGMSKPGDLHYYARVHCYQAIRKHYPHNIAMLSLLPMAMRMAGPREGILNAIVRQNYGCTHMIVGPHHAAPPDQRTQDAQFYAPYAAQEMLARFQNELDIRMVPIRQQRYVPRLQQFMDVDRIERDHEHSLDFTAVDLDRCLARGDEIPGWFSYPEVISELRKVCPPRSRKGITLFFTGLSGSGKSTIAKIVYGKFIEAGGRPVTLLDGDIVRQHLSSELGFSKQHRDLNIRRIGYVASEITKNGGVAICAPIAPYTATRRAVREMIEEHGAFIEIHVATPLEVCEQRDRKGLYAKARKGIIPEFTGISDPYEVPERPEMRIDTTELTPMQAVQEIMLYLLREGYLDDADRAARAR